jgi:hypothetical protein
MARLQSGTRIYGNAVIDTNLSINGNSGIVDATSNITGALKVAGGIGVTGNVFSTGIITGINANLGNLVIANYFTGTLTTNAQPNITSVGTLTGLSVSGNTTITGNLVVTGSTTTINSTNTSYTDSIIDLHTDKNLDPLLVDDGLDIGIKVHYFKSSDKHAFFGFSNDTQAFEYYVDGTETSGVFSGTYGNIKGLTFISTATTGTSPFTVNSTTEVANLKSQYANTADTANTANTVTVASQPNITSVGTLSQLTVNGITTLGNIGNVKIYGGSNGYVLKTDGTGNLNWVVSTSGTGNANVSGSNTQIQYNDGNNLAGSANLTFDVTTKTLTVDKIVANGSGLTSIAGANVTGFVPNANIANTAYSVGGGNVSGQVGNALVAGTVYTNAQPNITSVGNLSSLTVDNGSYGNVVITQFASVFATGSGPNPRAIYQATAADGVAGIGMQAVSSGPGQIYANTSIIFTTGATIRDKDYPTGGTTRATLDSNGLSVTGNITSTNANLGNLATANYFSGGGGSLSNITGANVTGQVGNALVAGTVYTNAQPNITSVGTLTGLSVSGDIIPTANIVYDLGNSTNSFRDLYLSGNTIKLGGATISANNGVVTITNKNGGNLTVSGSTGVSSNNSAILNGNSNVIVTANSNVNFSINGTSNVLVVSNTGANIKGTVTANYLSGDGSQISNISTSSINSTSLLTSTATFVTSNISNIVAGSTVSVIADYSNTSYPGGVFTIAQLGPVSLTMTDVWKESGSATKNAYANYLANSVNVNNVNVTFTLANATFSVQSSDYINIGSANITGANILALSITGNSGTYTIPSSYIGNTVETTTTSSVSAHLTTSRGVYTATGTTLTATQAVAFTVNSVSGSFPNSTVPYFSLNQSFNWSVSVTGTASSGNLTYNSGVSLTSSGATSGTSGSIDSTTSQTLTTSDYYGAGLYGYGSRTIPNTVTGTVSAATKYYPIFYKITSSASIPTFTTSDTYLTHNYVIGDGATTSASTSDYLWLVIPGTSSHTFAYTFLGSPVGQDPAVTGSQTISGYSYNIYGFTNFSAATFLYTVT